MQVFQSTLKQAAELEGIGVHSGKKAVLRLLPAPEGHGIVFYRPGKDGQMLRFPALARQSRPADLCTVLEAEGAAAETVETIEHIMAALAACGADNVRAELSGREAPILDGSAALYMQAIAAAGLKRQKAKRQYWRVLKKVRAEAGDGGGFAEFLPLPQGAAAQQLFDIEIDFAAKAIGRQHIAFALERASFAENVAAARTFGFLRDAEKLRAMGLAQGASFENSVVLDDSGAVLNPQALSAPDAFVRHKALDAVGDTALLGRPFIGLFRSFRSGHRLNAAAVGALLAEKGGCETAELG